MTEEQKNELRLIIERLNTKLNMNRNEILVWLKGSQFDDRFHASRFEYIEAELASYVLTEIDTLIEIKQKQPLVSLSNVPGSKI